MQCPSYLRPKNVLLDFSQFADKRAACELLGALMTDCISSMAPILNWAFGQNFDK